MVVSTQDGKIKADFGDGALRTLDPVNNQSDRHIDLGYSITSMASQGGSFENVILYVDTNMKNFVDMKMRMLIFRALKITCKCMSPTAKNTRN